MAAVQLLLGFGLIATDVIAKIDATLERLGSRWVRRAAPTDPSPTPSCSCRLGSAPTEQFGLDKPAGVLWKVGESSSSGHTSSEEARRDQTTQFPCLARGSSYVVSSDRRESYDAVAALTPLTQCIKT